MNSLRKILGLLMALMLVGFALPSSAASTTKVFNATFPPLLSAGGPQQISVTFYNTTPGVSTINSIKIFPAPGVTLTTTVSPGTGAMQGGALVITNFTGIKSQQNLTFTLTITAPDPCVPLTWPKPVANTGNSLNGDNFGWNGVDSVQLASACWTGPVACGGSFSDGTPGAPGYVSVEVSNTFKDDTSCSGSTFNYSVKNTLLIDNKLIVVLSDPNAAFTAIVNSDEFPVDANGYASRRLKVSWEPPFDALHTISAPTCKCSSASMACMPIDTVSTDFYFNQMVRACVTDYTWMLGNTIDPATGLQKVRYQAIMNAIGNDPAMAFE